MIRCCSCKKEYDFEGNIFRVDRNTNCPILICPHCGFKHAVSFMPFENKIENLKKAEKIELTTNYPLLGASRIANASREDLSGIDDGDIRAWEVCGASYVNKSKDVTSQEGWPYGVTFSSDGTKMYIVGWDTGTVYQYTLSTAWDVSTASYVNKSKDVTSQDSYPNAITFSPDGAKMYILGDDSSTVYQYTLSTAWDVSTASYANKSKDISSQYPSLYSRDVAFSSDGTKMYIVGYTTDIIYQYTLSTAWDVSTASYANKSKDVTPQASSAHALSFSPDGAKMYIMCCDTSRAYQYTLSTAWDVSTASYTNKSKDISSQDLRPLAVFFSSDGAKMYILGADTDKVYQYILSWIKTNDFILATRIYGSKGAYNFAYKLKWRNVTDGGVFADVGETGEISFNANTVLVDGQSLLVANKICGVQSGYAWQNGMESEGDNRLPDSGTYSLADEYYTEFQWALDCNSAHDGDEYEFAIYELTNWTLIGTCLATITMVITIIGGLSMKWNGVAISKWNGVVINKLNGVD